jgi:hypothetical protein
MKRSGLGFAVGAREVRAVLVRAGAIAWHGCAPFADAPSIATALRDVLAQAPRLPFATRVTVVISPAWVQAKPLPGLPSVKPARLANQLLRENQKAFFLWKGSLAAIADVQQLGGAVVWGAAYDREVIDALNRALHAARVTVRVVSPAVVAIVAALPNRTITWSDGDQGFELEGDGNRLRRAERMFVDAAVPPSALPAPLARLGDDAQRFLDAYGAAVAPRKMALAWRLQSDEARSRARAHAGNAVLITVLVAAAAFAALGPGFRARNFARVANAELTKNHRAQLELARTEGDLRRVTQLLNRVESFRAERGRVTRILGELAESIPDSTAMLTFHVDSVEGAFTAIAPHVADVLPELATVDGIVAPRIVGSVTREVFGGVHVERASFHFRRSRPGSTPVRQGTR